MVKKLGVQMRGTSGGSVDETRARMFTGSKVALDDEVTYDAVRWRVEDVQFHHILHGVSGYYDCTIIQIELEATSHENVPHVNVPHVNVAHVDSSHDNAPHSDSPHGDDVHINEPHTNTAHVNVAYVDVVHENTPHDNHPHVNDSHTNTVHTDTPHTDIAHGDAAHTNVTFADSSHVDIPHGNAVHENTAHTDHADGAHSNTPHVNVGHNDAAHTNIPHANTAHADAGHNDAAHQNFPHVNLAYVDTAHSNTPHVNEPHSNVSHDNHPHSNASHDNAAHLNAPHSNTPHSDSEHDNAPHLNAPHSNTQHSDTPHLDSVHDDVPHANVPHSNVPHSNVPAPYYEYLYTEGSGDPYSVKYGNSSGDGPYTVMAAGGWLSTGLAGQRKLVRTSGNALYSVYTKTDSMVYVKKSIDGGATWTDETLLSTVAGMDVNSQEYVSIAVDSDDYLHVVWSGGDTVYAPYPQVWYTKFTGTWSVPVRISTAAGMDTTAQTQYPAMAIDSADHVHVVWYGCATGYTGMTEIWYTEYTGSWSTPVRISVTAGNAHRYPAIAVDASNHPHVAWSIMDVDAPNNFQIWYTEYTTGWSVPMKLSTAVGMTGYNQWDPSVAVAPNGHVQVVWTGRGTANPDYLQIWYTEYTTAWSAPVIVSSGAAYDEDEGTVAVDSNGQIHVMWHRWAGTYADIWVATYTTSWSTPALLESGDTNSYPSPRWGYWNNPEP